LKIKLQEEENCFENIFAINTNELFVDIQLFTGINIQMKKKS